jgi:hypothetical protein
VTDTYTSLVERPPIGSGSLIKIAHSPKFNRDIPSGRRQENSRRRPMKNGFWSSRVLFHVMDDKSNRCAHYQRCMDCPGRNPKLSPDHSRLPATVAVQDLATKMIWTPLLHDLRQDFPRGHLAPARWPDQFRSSMARCEKGRAPCRLQNLALQ